MSYKKTFLVHGTKCASCEIILERELKNLPGVEDVVASHDAGKITLTLADGVRVTTHDLARRVEKQGYRFAEAGSAPAVSARSAVGKDTGALLILVFGLYLLLRKSGWFSTSPDIEDISGLGAVFVIGLLAAFSTCTAILSGLIVAVSSATTEALGSATSLARRLRPHLLFNFGRLAGFFALGALMGVIGKAFVLSSFLNGVLVVAVAVLMLLLGLNLLGFAPGWTPRPPKWLSHAIHDMGESRRPFMPMLLGAGTFFLPCGFTQSMQLLALSTGDPLRAGLIMFTFALGTTPALLGLGVAASRAKGKALSSITKFAGAFVLALGIFNLQNGATLLGIRWPTTAVASESWQPTIVDGKQVVQMEVMPNLTYEPRVIRVVSGTPVLWNVYAANRIGCAGTLLVPDLGLRARLKPGLNALSFTPIRPGAYLITCPMGMVSGTLVVE